MKTRSVASALAFACACTLFHGVARAQDAEPERTFESSAGLKILVGGNLWSAPSGGQGDGLGFGDEGGGFGWGGALYYEARFFKHLGLELDVGYDSSTIQRNVTYNGIVETTEKFTSSGPRISLLAKGIAPTPFGRLWVGIGPEFLLPSSADASVEITENRNLVANADQIENAASAEKTNSTMLAFALGLVFHVGDQFEIPVDLRAAKNLSQDSAWEDRVDVDPVALRYTVKAQSSWDFRLGAGFGYRF